MKNCFFPLPTLIHSNTILFYYGPWLKLKWKPPINPAHHPMGSIHSHFILNFLFECLFRLDWLGATSWAVSMFSAPVIIAFCRRKSTRLTAVIGGLVLALGILFTSFATLFHQVALSYGKFDIKTDEHFVFFVVVVVVMCFCVIIFKWNGCEIFDVKSWKSH